MAWDDVQDEDAAPLRPMRGSMKVSEEVDVYCPRCAMTHKATARLDEHGYPHTAWSERHDPDAIALRDHRDAIAEDGGKALALVLDAGDWMKVEEVLSAVLELNDPEEDTS